MVFAVIATILMIMMTIGLGFAAYLIITSSIKPPDVCVRWENATVFVEAYDNSSHYIGRIPIESQICTKKLPAYEVD